MSKGILFIEPEVITGCEDDRDLPSPWDELSEEELSAQMEKVEQEAQKRGKIDRIAGMRTKIFAIVKTYIEMQLDDSDVVEYVGRRFQLDTEQAELEVLVAKSLWKDMRE